MSTMKRAGMFIVALGALTLSGCKKIADAVDGDVGGRPRYAGIGIYAADGGWGKLKAAKAPADADAARVGDDRVVIVVVDSRTGEIRQCGNLSGYCVGMSPWDASLGAGQKGALGPESA